MRRTGIIIAAVLLLASVVLVVSAATNRLPSLAGGCEGLASSVAAWVSASLMPAPSSARPSAYAGATIRHQAAPLSSAQLGAPLVHGTFIGACGAPDDMKIVVNIAVKMGRAVSVSVTTLPPSPSVDACVERSTRDLRWDVSPKTDHVTVTY
ncbi:MAG: hypothetical protein M3O46_03915 [Myxococcota bacterium]|nr:hypothetical protein [Myxococcota bacterium]